MEPPELLMDFEDSHDSLQDQCLNSPRSCGKQLRMAKALQSAGHFSNPMISGGKLPRSSSVTPTIDVSEPYLDTQPDIYWQNLQQTLGETFNKPPSPMDDYLF